MINILLVCLAAIAALFIISFITGRRFGVLGLALAAGATLSNLWAAQLTPMVAAAGLSIVAPPLENLVAGALILAPALLLLFSGPTYHKKAERVAGSFAFSLLALAFLLPPLGSSLVLDTQGQTIYHFFLVNRVYIVTIGLAFSLFDLLTTRTPKHHTEKHRH